MTQTDIDIDPLSIDYIEPLIEELFYAFEDTQENAYVTAMNVLTFLVDEGYVE